MRVEMKSTRIRELLEKARDLPARPGVYLMKDKSGNVIYVGKARVLRNRVSSYFQLTEGDHIKTLRLVSNIDHFEVIVTSTEMEALILENNLIKQCTPKYNIKLKDGKNYPYLKVNTRDDYPCITVVRSRSDDSAKYFGPYSGTQTAYGIKTTLQKSLLLPSCSKKFPAEIGKGRPCLNHHIKQCCGLCTGKVSSEEYRELVDDAVSFLKGDVSAVMNAIEEKMYSSAQNEQYEKAAKYRDRLSALKKLYDKQKVQMNPNINCDVVSLYTDELSSCICVMSIRSGKLMDTENFVFSADEILDEDGFEQFLNRYYSNRNAVPKLIEINLTLPEESLAALSDYFTAIEQSRVQLHRPERGEFKRLSDLAYDNAREYSVQYRIKNERDNKLLMHMASLLKLEVVPDRIEAYDVSNSGDNEIVCGMIVINQAEFKRSKYRSFNIKSTDGQNDYGSMSEAIERRFAHAVTDSQKPEGEKTSGFEELPDLILLDGGVGHVHVIRNLLESKGIDIPVYGMVKDEFHKTRTLTDGENDINIAREQAVFTFIYNIQEEVHRFSLDRMDKKRRKTVKSSALEKIKGVGPAKVKSLLTHFKNVTAIKNASVEELKQADRITQTDAQNIYDHFRAQK